MSAPTQSEAKQRVTSGDDPVTEAQAQQWFTIQNSANWFYWLVGLSIVNTVLPLVGLNVQFIFGLGLTMAIDVLMMPPLSYVLDSIVLGFFILMGVFANRGHSWAFILGMLAYAVDAAILIYIQDWLSAAVHAWVMFSLSKGMMASMKFQTD